MGAITSNNYFGVEQLFWDLCKTDLEMTRYKEGLSVNTFITIRENSSETHR